MVLSTESLIEINGGTTISSTFLNALSRFITTVYEWGRAIGSTLNRMKNKTYCG